MGHFLTADFADFRRLFLEKRKGDGIKRDGDGEVNKGGKRARENKGERKGKRRKGKRGSARFFTQRSQRATEIIIGVKDGEKVCNIYTQRAQRAQRIGISPRVVSSCRRIVPCFPVSVSLWVRF